MYELGLGNISQLCFNHNLCRSQNVVFPLSQRVVLCSGVSVEQVLQSLEVSRLSAFVLVLCIFMWNIGLAIDVQINKSNTIFRLVCWRHKSGNPENLCSTRPLCFYNIHAISRR